MQHLSYIWVPNDELITNKVCLMDVVMCSYFNIHLKFQNGGYIYIYIYIYIFSQSKFSGSSVYIYIYSIYIFTKYLKNLPLQPISCKRNLIIYISLIPNPNTQTFSLTIYAHIYRVSQKNGNRTLECSSAFII